MSEWFVSYNPYIRTNPVPIDRAVSFFCDPPFFGVNIEVRIIRSITPWGWNPAWCANGLSPRMGSVTDGVCGPQGLHRDTKPTHEGTRFASPRSSGFFLLNGFPFGFVCEPETPRACGMRSHALFLIGLFQYLTDQFFLSTDYTD